MNTSLPWLSLLGINENGVEALTQEAQSLIASADLVAGGARHLALARSLIRGKTLEWISPIADGIAACMAMKPRPVCALASGDPFTFGVGALFARQVPMHEMRVLPMPSVFTLVAAKLGWALQDVAQVGLNGRPLERIIPTLQPGARIIALSTGGETPLQLAVLLKQRGFGEARMTLLERLGGPHERVREAQAHLFSFQEIAPLNCVAIKIPASAEALRASIPCGFGLADDYFASDGQLTKREIRAVTLSALAPRRGELLWDIGLGAGSIAIEWLLADSQNRAIGVEKDPARAMRARANAKNLGAPHLEVVEGEAPAALAELAPPHAVFIGGGGAMPDMIETAWQRLLPGGRLVVNAVSLETEARLLRAHREMGGRLIRLSVERAEPLGGVNGWRPAMTVMQWSIAK